jgi:aryl-alcohol dehydrogenase-like predicted oxidoreductase
MWGGSDEAESIRTIHSALDRGINFIDTAPVYGFGRSEEIVGKAVAQRGKRDQAVLATKVGLEWKKDESLFRNSSPRRIRREIEDSLKRLQTTYIDLYQVHWPDSAVPIQETARTLLDLQKEGKIRAIGVSNYSPDEMDEFRKAASITAVQPPYNLFERDAERAVIPCAKKNGISILAYGAICRGLLSGKMRPGTKFKDDDLRAHDPKFQEPRFSHYLKAVDELARLASTRYGKPVLALALRWAIDRGAIPLWGARNPSQLGPIEDVLGWTLDPSAMEEIDGIIARAVPDPVGPEFMAPPVHS